MKNFKMIILKVSAMSILLMILLLSNKVESDNYLLYCLIISYVVVKSIFYSVMYFNRHGFQKRGVFQEEIQISCN